MTPGDIREVQDELKKPFTAPSNFNHELADFENAATMLEDNEAPLSDVNLYMILLGKAGGIPILQQVLHTYKDNKETVDIVGCYQYLRENYIRRAELAQEQVNTYAAVAAVGDTQYKGQGTSGKRSKKRDNSESKRTDRVEKFCWVHSHKGPQTTHVSSECKTMINQPQRYSKEMRTATSYETCPYKEV
jgi:hypothetical protein